jgi:hypothetical protein
VSWYVKRGDVKELTPTSPPVRLTGGGVVKWQHVVSYLTPLADTHEMPFCGPVVRGTFKGVLYVYVTEEKPMFLGRTKQRLILDCDQANFMIMSGMVGGGGGGEGASGADSRAVNQDSRKKKTKERKRKRKDKGKRQDSSSSASPTESDEEEEDGEEEEGE